MEKRKEPPAWMAAISPVPDWGIEYSREVDETFRVTARWWAYDGEQTSANPGPREVVIQLLPGAHPRAQRRGINTGLLRRAEQVVGQLCEEVVGAVPFNDGAELARRLLLDGGPTSPRGGGDQFYIRLLHVHDELVELAYADPIGAIALALERPRATVKTQLRTARARIPFWTSKQREEDGNG